jgi:hypothetical protein
MRSFFSIHWPYPSQGKTPRISSRWICLGIPSINLLLNHSLIFLVWIPAWYS